MTRDDIIDRTWNLTEIDRVKSLLSLRVQRLMPTQAEWRRRHIEVSRWWAEMEMMRGAAIDMAREECP